MEMVMKFPNGETHNLLIEVFNYKQACALQIGYTSGFSGQRHGHELECVWWMCVGVVVSFDVILKKHCSLRLVVGLLSQMLRGLVIQLASVVFGSPSMLPAFFAPPADVCKLALLERTQSLISSKCFSACWIFEGACPNVESTSWRGTESSDSSLY